MFDELKIPMEYNPVAATPPTVSKSIGESDTDTGVSLSSATLNYRILGKDAHIFEAFKDAYAWDGIDLEDQHQHGGKDDF